MTFTFWYWYCACWCKSDLLNNFCVLRYWALELRKIKTYNKSTKWKVPQKRCLLDTLQLTRERLHWTSTLRNKKSCFHPIPGGGAVVRAPNGLRQRLGRWPPTTSVRETFEYLHYESSPEKIWDGLRLLRGNEQKHHGLWSRTEMVLSGIRSLAS